MKIGIIGAGQLGRMLGLSAIPLGLRCEFLDTSVDAPASAVGPIHPGALDDAEAIVAFSRNVDVLTTEIENVASEALEAAAQHCYVAPPSDVIAAAQDRLSEKRLFAQFGIATAQYEVLDSTADAAALSFDSTDARIIKTRRLGYDGRGQRLVRSAEQAAAAFDELGGVPAIAEHLVDFSCEASLIAVRSRDGNVVFYPLCENTHSNGILATTIAPFDAPQLQTQAQQQVSRLLEQTNYVGVLTVEFFVTGDGLVANEMAPRVHNSGHWSIEGAVTSQFENHIRAVAGLPLGDPSARGHAAMLNLIGTMPPRDRLLATAGAHLHDYGKSPRPGRKLGHCTLVDPDRKALVNRLKALQNAIS